jgi:hypothetical protein
MLSHRFSSSNREVVLGVGSEGYTYTIEDAGATRKVAFESEELSLEQQEDRPACPLL